MITEVLLTILAIAVTLTPLFFAVGRGVNNIKDAVVEAASDGKITQEEVLKILHETSRTIKILHRIYIRIFL